jgi:AraC family transcriptional regulator, arabinose operon regulatory protein
MIPANTLILARDFGHVTCESSWKWNTRERPLEDYDLWYVWGGEGTLILNGVPYMLSKGSCFLFRKGDRTVAEHNPAKPLVVSFVHFEIDGDDRGFALDAELPQSYRRVRDTGMMETYLNRCIRALNEHSYQYEEEARQILALMLHFMNREQYESQHAQLANANIMEIHEIANYIRQHPSVWHRIPKLAQRVGLSPRYFALKFKEIMGVPIETFIIQVRICRAEHLLKYNQMLVSEVSDALGYKNMYYFSRQFKAYTGRAPSHVRKRMTTLENQ